MAASQDDKIPLISHLEELKPRLIRSLIALGVGFFISWAFKERLLKIIVKPVAGILPKESFLIFTSPPEAFITYLKISFFTGLLLAAPYIFLQLWKFVSPGLYDHEKRHVIPFMFFSGLLFLSGVFFCYFIVLPLAFEFFIGFTTDFLRPLFSLKEYLSLSLLLLFMFGLSFELPVFIFFLAKVGLVDSAFLRKHRRYAILLIFIIAAVLTPPDVLSQILMAIPLMGLYELGIVLAKFARRKKEKRESQETDSDD